MTMTNDFGYAYVVKRYHLDPNGEPYESAFSVGDNCGWFWYRKLIGSLNYDGVELLYRGTRVASWGVVE